MVVRRGRRWRIRFDRPPGFNADTGEVERRQPTRRGFRMRREAEQALREELAAVNHQRHVEIRKDTLGARLPAIRLHDMRHTYASIALASGMPITVVSRRLGHASISITLDVDGHCLPADDEAAAATVAAAILGVPG